MIQGSRVNAASRLMQKSLPSFPVIIQQRPLLRPPASNVPDTSFLCGGLLEEARERSAYSSFKRQRNETYVMISFLSLSFLRPPNAILVPGMYFLGFSR